MYVIEDIFSESALREFRNDIENEMNGKWDDKKEFERKTKFFCHCGCHYHYSGIDNEPNLYPKFLQKIEYWMYEAIESAFPEFKGITDKKFRSCCCNGNLYDKNVGINQHSDDEQIFDVLNNPTMILSISFGATAKFTISQNEEFDQNYDIEIPFGDVDIKNGTIVIMFGWFQKYWKHGIDPPLPVDMYRYNFTYRYILKHECLQRMFKLQDWENGDKSILNDALHKLPTADNPDDVPYASDPDQY